MTPPEPAATGNDEVAAIERARHALARRLMQGRLHEHLARQAGVDLDQAGLAVLYVLWEPGTSLRATSGSRPRWPAGRTRTATNSPAWWPGWPATWGQVRTAGFSVYLTDCERCRAYRFCRSNPQRSASWVTPY
jgi:hypothetical protein